MAKFICLKNKVSLQKLELKISFIEDKRAAIRLFYKSLVEQDLGLSHPVIDEVRRWHTLLGTKFRKQLYHQRETASS